MNRRAAPIAPSSRFRMSRSFGIPRALVTGLNVRAIPTVHVAPVLEADGGDEVLGAGRGVERSPRKRLGLSIAALGGGGSHRGGKAVSRSRAAGPSMRQCTSCSG